MLKRALLSVLASLNNPLLKPAQLEQKKAETHTARHTHKVDKKQ